MQTLRVIKRPILHPYRVAAKDEIIQTREGAVAARAGDYILTGTEGEQWPIPAAKFHASYEFDGDWLCRKKPLEVLALQMECRFAVRVAWQEGVLAGEPGDWLVQYGEGDFGVVGAEIFARTYVALGPASRSLDLHHAAILPAARLPEPAPAA